MKVRIVYTLLLLVFSLFSLTVIGQLATTEEDARNDRDKAAKVWKDAFRERETAESDYGLSNDVMNFLHARKGDTDVEMRDNWEDIRDAARTIATDLVTAATTREVKGAISSIASTAINGIADIMDWKDLKAQSSNIASDLASETTNNSKLYQAFFTALTTETILKKRYDDAFAHWQSFVSCVGCNVPGVDHPPHPECWNKKWGCTEKNVRTCAHICDYAPVTCSGCKEEIANEKHISAADKALHQEVACGGCFTPYYLCDSRSVKVHRVRVCYRSIYTPVWVDETDSRFWTPYPFSGSTKYKWLGYCEKSYYACQQHNTTCSIPSYRCDDHGVFDFYCPAWNSTSHSCAICTTD